MIVHIEQADNGFILASYSDDLSETKTVEVCKSDDELVSALGKLLKEEVLCYMDAELTNAVSFSFNPQKTKTKC